MGVSAEGLHPSFGVTRDRYWWWNRTRVEARDKGNLKVVFFFDHRSSLAETPLLAKIGPNRAVKSLHRYTGVAYGKESDRAELERWGRRFPFAELIIGLDNNGGTLPDAKRIVLTE